MEAATPLGQEICQLVQGGPFICIHLFAWSLVPLPTHIQ